METERSLSDGTSDKLIDALSRLGPVELRVLHLAITKAASLETCGRGAEGDILLLRLLRRLRLPASPVTGMVDASANRAGRIWRKGISRDH